MSDARPCRVVFIDEKLHLAYQNLESGRFEDRELHSKLKDALTQIKQNPLCGIRVPSRLWPKEYVRKGIKILWKYDLPDGWRLLYTLTGDKIEVVAIILEWMTHKQYEKRFGYHKN